MVINNKEYESITIVGTDNEVLAIVSDTDIVSRNGYNILLEENSQLPQDYLTCRHLAQKLVYTE